MNQDKLRIVNKIFNDDTIRAVWDNKAEKEAWIRKRIGKSQSC